MIQLRKEQRKKERAHFKSKMQNQMKKTPKKVGKTRDDEYEDFYSESINWLRNRDAKRVEKQSINIERKVIEDKSHPFQPHVNKYLPNTKYAGISFLKRQEMLEKERKEKLRCLSRSQERKFSYSPKLINKKFKNSSKKKRKNSKSKKSKVSNKIRSEVDRILNFDDPKAMYYIHKEQEKRTPSKSRSKSVLDIREPSTIKFKEYSNYLYGRESPDGTKRFVKEVKKAKVNKNKIAINSKKDPKNPRNRSRNSSHNKSGVRKPSPKRNINKKLNDEYDKYEFKMSFRDSFLSKRESQEILFN